MHQIPAKPPHDYPALIERERAALIDVLKSIGDDEWSNPTPCPGWSVHDIVLHILGSDIGVISRQRDNFDGTPGPSGSTPAVFAEFLDDLNESWVASLRRMSPKLSIDLLSVTGEQMIDLYRTTDSGAEDAAVSWASADPVPRWFDHAREMTERWVHHQQILEAIGASAWLEPEMLGPVLDTFSHAYHHTLSALRRPAGTSAGIDITGPVSRSWRWESTGQGWISGAAAPETLMTMDASMAWRLLTNGLPPGSWPSPAPTKDQAVGRVLQRTRAILGTPNG